MRWSSTGTNAAPQPNSYHHHHATETGCWQRSHITLQEETGLQRRSGKPVKRRSNNRSKRRAGVILQSVAARIQLAVCCDWCTVRLGQKTYYCGCLYVFDSGLFACEPLRQWRTAGCLLSGGFLDSRLSPTLCGKIGSWQASDHWLPSERFIPSFSNWIPPNGDFNTSITKPHCTGGSCYVAIKPSILINKPH